VKILERQISSILHYKGVMVTIYDFDGTRYPMVTYGMNRISEIEIIENIC
jgi:hypothetical protein